MMVDERRYADRYDERGAVGAVIVLGILQAIVFYNHFAVALTFLFALAIGFWIMRWTASIAALIAFLIGWVLAAVTNWMERGRVADLLLGAALAFLGGLIAGGIFDVLRAETVPDGMEGETR